ncbi:MAG: hypothetical protein ACJAVV_002379 [Alphaproteobacteria bacterium]|jgi:hypothetical protein
MINDDGFQQWLRQVIAEKEAFGLNLRINAQLLIVKQP